MEAGKTAQSVKHLTHKAWMPQSETKECFLHKDSGSTLGTRIVCARAYAQYKRDLFSSLKLERREKEKKSRSMRSHGKDTALAEVAL